MKRYAIIILLVIVAAFGGLLAFCESHDNRTADSLSAYCRIDFQGLRGSDGTATSARFTLWDTRYDGEKPSTHLKLYTDDKAGTHGCRQAGIVRALAEDKRDLGLPAGCRPAGHRRSQDGALRVLLSERQDHRPAAQ